MSCRNGRRREDERKGRHTSSDKGEQKHEPQKHKRENDVHAEGGDEEDERHECHGDVVEALGGVVGSARGAAFCGCEAGEGGVRGVLVVGEGAPVAAVDYEDCEGEGWGALVVSWWGLVVSLLIYLCGCWGDDIQLPSTNSAIPAMVMAMVPRK